MKTATSCFPVALALGAALMTVQFAQAQGGPSGGVTNTITDPSNAVWNAESVLTEMDFTISNKNGTVVTISYPVSVQQWGNGRLSGAGTANVQLDDQITPLTFQGDYKVTGSVTSNRGRGRASLNSIVKGTADFQGAIRKLVAKHAAKLSFDNLSGTASGIDKNSASASGLGSISGRDSFSQNLDSIFPGDGSWTLALFGLNTDAKNKITGSAVVTLNSGEMFQYSVRGVFKTKTGTSKLVLSAFDAATKGSTLVVGMDGNSVVAIKGKISGQFVRVALP